MSIKIPTIHFKGVGHYAPERRLTNEDLSKLVDTSDEWIRTRTGISERRLAAEGETTSDLAAAAAREALAKAGKTPEEVDLLLVATITPDMPFPSTSCLVQKKLGLRPIPCLDIQAACSGFLYATEMASGLLATGKYRNALVIGAEKLSTITDWEDRATCVLFGDGAGAAFLEPVEDPGHGILSISLGADGSNPELLYMPGGGSAQPASLESIEARAHFLKMNGREVFKLAVRAMETAAKKVLEEQDLTPDDIDLVIPHQANTRIIEAISQRVGVPMDRFYVNLERFGNTSAASIPIAFSEALAEGRIQRGHRILLVGFGAGLTWAAGLVRF